MIDKELLYKNLNEGIIDERFRAFGLNLNKSLDLIKQHGGLSRIVNNFEDKIIIVVGAGPSLDKNFDLLKKYQHRDEIIILSTDMALKPLIKHSIYPQYVISCETIPVDFFSSIDTKDIHLLAFSCMSNINLKKWKGAISFYNWMLSNPEYNVLWEKSGEDLGFVATGSIVTTQAVSLALGCRIRSLVLVGNDLGFGARYYAKESVAYYNSLIKLNRYSVFQTVDMNLSRKKREYEIRRGSRVFYTNSQFLAAKMWLEELFGKQDIPIYDCSEPGCSEKYVAKISLKDFFKTLQRKRKKKRR
ncbi:6-hydroxymethylpterin diphosphokinase MptE-like protein [Spirochaetota bacterium]